MTIVQDLPLEAIEDGIPPRAGLQTSAGKVLAILDCFEGPGTILALATIARRTGVSKPSTHRLLAVLEEGGFVVRAEGGYALHRRVFELGSKVADARPRGTRDAAMPYLAELYARTGLTVHLAVLDAGSILYLEKLFGPQSCHTPTHVGSRAKVTCTALGKAILAFAGEASIHAQLARGLPRLTERSITSVKVLTDQLFDIRVRGSATDYEESKLGLYCVAAPVFRSREHPAVAAISITSNSASVTRQTSLVTAAATALSDKLGRSALAGHEN